MILRWTVVWALAVGLCLAHQQAWAQDNTGQQLYNRWAETMQNHLDGWDAHKTKWNESIGWHASPMLRGLVRGYAVSHKERWLKHLTQQVDVLMDRLKVEPIPDAKTEKAFPGWGHSITGEALVLEPILEFVELAQTDPKVPEAYRKKAAEYLKTIDPEMILKWDQAGRWKETHMDCGTYTEGISLPHNKNAHLGSMLLVAARVTPSAERRILYLEKARKLARRWRKFLKVGGEGYIWHYWDAAGRWDFDEKGQSKHWTSLEHRGYASSDTNFMADAYEHGLVFDRRDVEKHVWTFLHRIWNGDEEDPQYRPLGWFNPKYDKCTVLGGLAPYNKQVMELLRKQTEKVATGWGGISGVPDYLLKKRRGVGWKRPHADYGRMLKEALEKRRPPEPKPATPVVE